MEKSHLLFVTCLLVSPSASSDQLCQKISVTRHILKLPISSSPPFLALRPPSSSSSSSLPTPSPIVSGSQSSPSPLASSSSTQTVPTAAPLVSEGVETQRAPSSFSTTPSATGVLPSRVELASDSTAPSLFSNVPIASSSSSASSFLPSSKSLFPLPVSIRPSSYPSDSPSSSTSSPSSSLSSPSSACWTSGRKGRAISLSPDHHGNLWVLTTSSSGAQLIPDAVWVLNFTSMTWNDLGYPSGETEDAAGNYPGTSAFATSSSSSSSTSAPSGATTTQEIMRTSESPATSVVLRPAVFCSWSKGLIMIYTYQGSCHTWLLPYNSGRWVKLKAFKSLESPSEVISVDASWCERLQDSLWLLTTNRQRPRVEDKPREEVPPDGASESSSVDYQSYQQTLWKLDHKGKWSPLAVTGDRDKSPLPSHNARTWTDNQGGLFVLYENVNGESDLRIVRFDQTSGTRTVISMESSPLDTLWIPNSNGILYSIYSGPDGNRWIKTSDYRTGEVLSIDNFDTPVRIDILVRIDGTVYNNIPYCNVLSETSDSVRRTVLELHRFSPASTGCSKNTSIINYQYSAYEEVTMVHESRSIAATTDHRMFDNRAIIGDSKSSQVSIKESESIEREAEVVFTLSPPGISRSGETIGETGLSRSSSVGENIIFSDIEEVMGGTNTAGPHQRNRNHTNDSIIFFSLSLSIFALVGIVIFVRRCVRCPPAAELGERGDLRGKPPSPLPPVLYSIVPDDPNYDTNVTDSPCPSYSAIYEVPTPGDETPNAITPNCGTPNFMTPNMTTPVGDTPYSMTPNATTPVSTSPNIAIRHDSMTPRDFSMEVSYAITNSAADAINIATNNAFKNCYINTTQF